MIYVDLNGATGPNIAGRDIFSFELALNESGGAITELSFPDKNRSPDIIKKSCADSKTYSRPGTGQTYFNGLTCSTLIFQNGW